MKALTCIRNVHPYTSTTKFQKFVLLQNSCPLAEIQKQDEIMQVDNALILCLGFFP